MHGEEESFEWPKTLQGSQLEIVEISLGVRNLKKKNQTSPKSPHVVREGFKKIVLTHPKTTPANSVVRHDWNFKWLWLLLSDETEKNSFLAANPPDEFSTNRDKKVTPCPRLNILLDL